MYILYLVIWIQAFEFSLYRREKDNIYNSVEEKHENIYETDLGRFPVFFKSLT